MKLSRLLRAGLLTAVIDGLFSSALVVFFYDSTFARLWQGVASTLLGPDAFTGGTRTVLIGLLMHLGVAFGWSTVFFLLYEGLAGVRAATSTPAGVVLTAAIYGPVIWLVMSLAVIPFLTGRPVSFTVRWWIQLIGHFPFVGLPIVASIAERRLESGQP